MTESENTHRAFGRRRRRNHPGGRDERIVLKVSPAEDSELRARAEDAGMTVQRLLVTGALSPATAVPVNHAEKVAAWKDVTEIRNLLSGIAVNMNQIARHANSEREVPADFEAAVDAVARASDRVRDAFGEVFAVSFPATKKADAGGERDTPGGPITAAEGEGWSV
ncbi:MAG: plasmid mobilization relaxosome protein MobC [Gordonia sp. (in: high G+C Gram-positive bacteria)]|nr:MAG: plasmid mobilization relaxosome protein MobC [Gordonia sp. (in: high G+C Gram-positive bacteria)]